MHQRSPQSQHLAQRRYCRVGDPEQPAGRRSCRNAVFTLEGDTLEGISLASSALLGAQPSWKPGESGPRTRCSSSASLPQPSLTPGESGPRVRLSSKSSQSGDSALTTLRQSRSRTVSRSCPEARRME
eukprot:scaffold95806_cov77-Phaeocystis_antarctica.AAC.1